MLVPIRVTASQFLDARLSHNCIISFYFHFAIKYWGSKISETNKIPQFDPPCISRVYQPLPGRQVFPCLYLLLGFTIFVVRKWRVTSSETNKAKPFDARSNSRDRQPVPWRPGLHQIWNSEMVWNCYYNGFCFRLFTALSGVKTLPLSCARVVRESAT